MGKQILVSIITIIVLWGCASSTVIHSTPSNAKVFVDGSFKCNTPCKITDKKPVMSETSLILKKEGYKDLRTSIYRGEKVLVGPAIGGLFFWPIWIWAGGYYPERTFSLGKEGAIRRPIDRGVEIEKRKVLLGSGSGFAINSEGYIVTNHHVIDEGISILIRGVDGDFHNTFKAVVVAKDIYNDLALLKIIDENFTRFSTIPYTVNNSYSDVGESVFALGYPLRATMGDEVKLTNGIISSKTGFQGNISTYQVTVPVQPGNSGGPLLNENGNVIGIINSKHLRADNAAYAIKSTYLFNLINSLDEKISVAKGVQLTNLKLSDQVKSVKKFVFIVEVYQ